jgi:indolepyruvate ferredoxin oxidoreductase alpha subunit
MSTTTHEGATVHAEAAEPKMAETATAEAANAEPTTAEAASEPTTADTMGAAMPRQSPPDRRVLLGDEAVALGALHGGVTAAYAYPGTPSTEILERLLDEKDAGAELNVSWCANEKTAYEAALGVSMVGRRALVTMKHVGLNVAADPFINSAIVTLGGGLVVVVADDPGMHSSQNEQDTRVLADFAHTLCLEPSSQQEAYNMAREAFGLSERFHLPVVLRLVTRLAHSRARVTLSPPLAPNPLRRAENPADWILLPNNARRLWQGLLDQQPELLAHSDGSPHNPLLISGNDRGLGVITTGIARNYLAENLPDLDFTPSHLHVGSYPIPAARLRRLAAHCERLLVLEEGFPFVERALRGLLPSDTTVAGKLDGTLPRAGELTPDSVRQALDLPRRERRAPLTVRLPIRPPQLCDGCPHRDGYAALAKALATRPDAVVAGDIGCYTLGALPPLSAIESCVCMGASVGMAKGAADAGVHPAVGVIGDSTFLHSGVTALMDAVSADTPMTLIILCNDAVGMTGAQPTILPVERLQDVVLGLGVDPAHCRVCEAHPSKVKQLAAVLGEELDHRGLSVVIAGRECLARRSRRKASGR